MNPTDLKNIGAAFKQPKVSGPVPTPAKPANSQSAMQPIPPNNFTRRIAVSGPVKPAQPIKSVEKGFSLVNFSKSGIVKDDQIYNSNFRFKTQEALKGTLKNFADRKTVVDLLWDRRGSGIAAYEIKAGLNKLEASGKLRPDQVRAVRKKLSLY